MSVRAGGHRRCPRLEPGRRTRSPDVQLIWCNHSRRTREVRSWAESRSSGRRVRSRQAESHRRRCRLACLFRGLQGAPKSLGEPTGQYGCPDRGRGAGNASQQGSIPARFLLACSPGDVLRRAECAPLLIALVGATAYYAAARLAANQFSREAWFETAGLLLIMGLAVAVLYFAEGSEIAVTTVLDRDEDELGLTDSTKSRLRKLRDSVNDFVSGRQFIVVVVVVLFAGLCEEFAKNAPKPPASWHASFLFTDGVVKTYGFAFPILIALWLSQLFSKFVAQRRPVTFLQSPTTQKLLVAGVWLGRTVMVGFVSTRLVRFFLRNKADDARSPSRVKL